MEEDFRGLGVDLKELSERVESFFKREGFNTHIDTISQWYRIQAVKVGTLRRVVGAARCLEVNIRGDPNSFEVEMTTGDWGKNLAASAIVGALTFGLGWLAAGVSALTYKQLEERMWDYVQWQVDELKGSAAEVQAPPAATIPIANLALGLPQCPRCNKRVRPTYNNCPHCGFDLESLQTKCSSCGFQVDPSFRLCPYCGKNLTVTTG